jgi:hypothetical protein
MKLEIPDELIKAVSEAVAGALHDIDLKPYDVEVAKFGVLIGIATAIMDLPAHADDWTAAQHLIGILDLLSTENETEWKQ